MSSTEVDIPCWMSKLQTDGLQRRPPANRPPIQPQPPPTAPGAPQRAWLLFKSHQTQPPESQPPPTEPQPTVPSQKERVMRDFLYGLNQIPPEQIGSGITREMERRWHMLQGLQVGRGCAALCALCWMGCGSFEEGGIDSLTDCSASQLPRPLLSNRLSRTQPPKPNPTAETEPRTATRRSSTACWWRTLRRWRR
jgi:hypothetical protein